MARACYSSRSPSPLSERGRLFTSAAIIGAAGLGRETNLLAGSGLPRPDGRWHAWLKLGAALALAALPLLLWQDYLRSIYRSTSAAGQHVIDRPLLVYLQVFQQTLGQVLRRRRPSSPRSSSASSCASPSRRPTSSTAGDYASPWWRVALPYALLMLTVHKVVWDGYPGAVTRVTLPLAFGFNVLLAREDRPALLALVHPRQPAPAARRAMLLPFPG